MKKLSNIVTFASLFLLGIIINSCSRDVAMIKIFSTYVNAVNQNDVNGALATHTQDAEFIIPGQHPIKGSDKIRSLLQWDSILQSQIMFDDLRVHGDTILAGAGSERNLWLKGIGLDSIAYTPGTRIVFEGELIRGIYPATLFSESRVEFGIRFQEFMSWAMQNASEELSQLMPDGFFIYNAESALEWIRLLDYYNSQNDKYNTDMPSI